jgi:hypothetical protein
VSLARWIHDTRRERPAAEDYGAGNGYPIDDRRTF